jgi:hypothetical protein
VFGRRGSFFQSSLSSARIFASVFFAREKRPSETSSE